jgi:cytidylate kinase
VTLVTLSASYGSAGGVIGRALAERLAVAFVDRAIPLGVAEELDVPLDDAVAHDMRLASSFLGRLMRSFAAADPGGFVPLPTEELTPDEFRQATEAVISRQAATGAGVILGRAGAVVLQADPRVLRARLDGPADRRVRQAMRYAGLDQETTERALAKADRAHVTYVKHFYGTDIHDPQLYHLVIDTTAISIDACVELIALAARSHTELAAG